MFIKGALTLLTGALLFWWYRYEEVLEGSATVHLQSEHDHFHLHVDLPDYMDVQPGDTLHIESLPELPDGRTREGEMSYESRVMLRKASWLQRNLIRKSSLVEVTELIEH